MGDLSRYHSSNSVRSCFRRLEGFDLLEARVAPQDVADDLEVGLVVGGHVHGAARPQGAVQGVEEARVEEAVLVVPLLGPRVGEEDVVGLHGVRRHEVGHRVVALHPQQAEVAQAAPLRLVVDLADAPQHAVDAEVVEVRMGARALQQEPPLAAAEVDFQRLGRARTGAPAAWGSASLPSRMRTLSFGGFTRAR
jgi:hypothetical protein